MGSQHGEKGRPAGPCFVGVDLGTSGAKAAAFDEAGRLVALGRREYGLSKPRPDWAEQDMESLWAATAAAIRQMLAQSPGLAGRVRAVGFSGQMHGLVMLDGALRPIRPAITWADQRSGGQIAALYAQVDPAWFHGLYRNRLSTGFLLPSLMWVRENEKEAYARLRHVLLPKDYIRLRLGGDLATDCSDASSTGLWDMAGRCWPAGLWPRLGLDPAVLPEARESCAPAGRVSRQGEGETGLAAGTPLACGGGDSLMMAVANGLIAPGPVSATIGTSCQLTCAVGAPVYDPELRTNTWCHARAGLWAVMGAHLSGGVALKWLRDNVLAAGGYDGMTALAAAVPAGSEGLLFLPYLSGERTPHNDPRARAIYLGLTLKHGRGHLVRAAMEGVAYSLRESLAIFQSLGLLATKIIAGGGGARSALFRQIQADMYGRPVYVNREAEQAALGAAITAAVSVGHFQSYEEACAAMARLSDEVTEPDPAAMAVYAENFPRFQKLYLANRELF